MKQINTIDFSIKIQNPKENDKIVHVSSLFMINKIFNSV